MKYLVLALFFCLGAAYAVPVKPAQTSALDLLTMLENIVEDKGHDLITKVVHLIHNVEDGVLSVKKIVPKVYEKIHQEADEVLSGLKKVSEEIEELLGKKSGNVYYGFDLLGGLTELTSGTKLSTVLSLLQLADKAHRVTEDAKDFVPKLELVLTKIQTKIEVHVTDLTKHVLKELGLQDIVAHGFAKEIEGLVEDVEEEAHVLILNLLHKMEEAFEVLETELPELYKKLESRIEEIRREAREVIEDIGKRIHTILGYGMLDFAGDLTKGTSLGTVIQVVSLVDKFNTVAQDAKNFGPHAQVLLEHSVKKVAESAQDFFEHAADIIAKSL